VIATALSLQGAPYRHGGSDRSGFDCSGLVQYVLAQHGIGHPRSVADQFAAGTPVAPAEVRPGDLVFFATSTAGPSHVGIAIGGDAFVHAPSSRGVVRTESLSAPYWRERYLAARRVF
jgi:cell wall-associated NlpC family hydrolase